MQDLRQKERELEERRREIRRRELAMEAQEKVERNSAVRISSLEGQVQELEKKLVLADTRIKGLEKENTQERLRAEKAEELLDDQAAIRIEAQDAAEAAKTALKEANKKVKGLERELAASQSELEGSQQALDGERLAHGKTQSELSEMGVANQEANLLLVELEQKLTAEKAKFQAEKDEHEKTRLIRKTIQDKVAKLIEAKCAAEKQLLEERASKGQPSREQLLTFLEEWTRSPPFDRAATHAKSHSFVVGYSEARTRIFEDLRKLKLDHHLQLGDYRAFKEERMLASGRTLSLPKKNPPPVGLSR